jgi:hypothetical protein
MKRVFSPISNVIRAEKERRHFLAERRCPGECGRRWWEGAPAQVSTERIEHESATDGQFEASPVPSLRRKCANLRGIFDFFTENAEIADWLAEGSGFELSVPISKLTDDNFQARFAR